MLHVVSHPEPGSGHPRAADNPGLTALVVHRAARRGHLSPDVDVDLQYGSLYGHAGAMDDARGLPNEWVPDLRRARTFLTVAEEVGLALREHRRKLGLSQRAYARRRGLSRAMLARLEAGAGQMRLDTISDALVGTGFMLCVTFSMDEPDPSPDDAASGCAAAADDEPEIHVAPRRVPPEAWAPTDLVAAVRGGSRRFPAHRKVYPVTNPPLWWWMHEFFNGPTEEPKWYAPVPRPDLTLFLGDLGDDDVGDAGGDNTPEDDAVASPSDEHDAA